MKRAQDVRYGWKQYKTSEGKAYYHNAGTGETKWTLPSGESLESRTDASDELPAGWKEYLTKEGRTAFFHAATKKTTYIRPGQEMEAPAQVVVSSPLAKRPKVDEESERSNRIGRGEALRRAAYQGVLHKVQEVLASMSLVERLLAIDEADEGKLNDPPSTHLTQ